MLFLDSALLLHSTLHILSRFFWNKVGLPADMWLAHGPLRSTCSSTADSEKNYSIDPSASAGYVRPARLWGRWKGEPARRRLSWFSAGPNDAYIVGVEEARTKVLCQSKRLVLVLDTSHFVGHIWRETRELDASRVEVTMGMEKVRMLGEVMERDVSYREMQLGKSGSS